MSTLDTLVIELVANTARLQGDMNKATGIVADSMRKVEGAVNLAKTAFAALGGAATLAGLVGMVKGSIDAAEALHDLSIQTGASVEALSAMAEVGKYTDTSVQTIAGAMNKLAKNMAVANEESKGTGQALKALGIDFDTFQKMKPEEQLLTVAKQMAGFADGSGKAAVAMTLFGKSGAEMLPFLKDYAKVGADAATVTTEQAARADEFNDRVTELRATFDRVVRTLALDLLPVLQKLLEGVGMAVKVFGAYLVLMVGLPAAVTAVKTAIIAKQMAMAAASAAAEMGIVANTGYAASMKAIIVQAGLLKVAFGVLFAAFAGWQIGKYLRENFLQAQLAGIAFVEGTLVAWERLKYGVKVAWEYIAASGKVALDAITATFAMMLDGIGRGLKALGADEMGRSLTALADRLKAGATASADLERNVASLRGEMERNITGVREITSAMADDAIATFQTAKATAEATAQLEYHADATTKAAAATKAAQDEKLEAIKITSEYMLEEIEITAKHIELTKEATVGASAWAKATEEVFSGLTDAIFRALESGKGFWNAFVSTIKNTFDNLVLRPTIEAIVRPVAGALGGLLGGAKSAFAASSGGGLGSIGSGAGLLSGIGGLGGLGTWGGALASTFGAGLGFGASWLGAGATLGGTLSGAGAMLAGGSLASVTAGIGALVGALGPIALGIGLLVKGFTRGPKKITEEGISGAIIGGDVTARQYANWKQSGSWFVGGRKGTKYSDLGEEASIALEQTTAAIYGGMSEYAKALGLPVELLSQVNYTFKAAKGKTEEETQKNLEAAFAGYREALAGQFANVLEPFRNAGETLADTLERLVAVQQASETLNQFGGVFSRIATLSVEAREELIGMAGGIEALIAKAQAFVGAYYTESEQAGIAARPILEAMQALGITDAGAYSTKAEFRALIESLDVSTTEGRQALNTLLSLAPSFAQVADYIAKAGGTLGDVAGAAPQIAVLEAMFAENQTATAYAERTAAGVAAVESAVEASGDNIVGAIASMQAALDSRLAAVEDALLRNSRDIVGAIEATA